MLNGSDWVFLGRVVLAAALGFAIGWERERSGHAAGDRTYALLSMGAALFTVLGMQTFPSGADKMVAGLITGVGFLGAGVILRQATGEIRGLTTAASVWAVAGAGAVIGAGRYLLGIALAALILVLLAWDRIPVLSKIGRVKSNEDKD